MKGYGPAGLVSPLPWITEDGPALASLSNSELCCGEKERERVSEQRSEFKTKANREQER